jgi:16S rRNA (cytidine1402-2'-O)-methyltransferase
MTSGRLVLIPWRDTGDRDPPPRALEAARRLELLLAEDPDRTRIQLVHQHGIECRAKTFLPIDLDEDGATVDAVRAALHRGDVGLFSSAGTPCFADPGAWLVRRIRADGTPIVTLAGASALATLLSLSGHDSARTPRFAFRFVASDGLDTVEPLVAGHPALPIVLFLTPDSFAPVVERIAAVDPPRRVVAFFDLGAPDDHIANLVEEASASSWATDLHSRAPRAFSEVALLVQPGPIGRRAQA